MRGLLTVQRPVAAGGDVSLQPAYRDGMVGIVNVDRGRGVVVAGVVGGVNAGWVVGTVSCSGMVMTGAGLTVVAGESFSSAGALVVVVADEDPDPEADEEPLVGETTDATGAGVLPVRSGTLSGGVASGGLALVMKRLKICAGSEPPLTFFTP
jgi:hypothetical protein